jgi:hypothetical protein
VKKPVIDVDDIKDAGNEAPSPVVDIASSSFTLQNAANALVTESAAIRATFIQFQDTLAGSLDRLTVFMVKEQVEAREDYQVSFRLLERITEMLERSLPRRAGVVPMEGPAARGTETVPVIERVQTPLFLTDSDPVDLPFAVEDDKDSEEGSGHGSKNEGVGHGNERGRDEHNGCGDTDEESGSEDKDAMVE